MSVVVICVILRQESWDILVARAARQMVKKNRWVSSDKEVPTVAYWMRVFIDEIKADCPRA